MREHAAANESLKLALHEQGGAALVVPSVELPKEGLEVLADDVVEHLSFLKTLSVARCEP